MKVLSPRPVNATHQGLLSGSLPSHQQYAPIPEETNTSGLGMTQNMATGQPGTGTSAVSRFQENFSPPAA